MRELSAVLDQILEVAPEFTKNLASVRESLQYTAPEVMNSRLLWKKAAEVLQAACPSNHPKFAQVHGIFCDVPVTSRKPGWGTVVGAQKVHYFTERGLSKCSKWLAPGGYTPDRVVGDRKDDSQTCKACLRRLKKGEK